MKAFQRQNHATNIELRLRLRANANVSKNVEEIPSINQFQQEIDEMVIIIGGIKFVDERKVNLFQYSLLVEDIIFHVIFNGFILFYAFQSIAFVILVFHTDNISKLALPQL